MGEWDYLSTHVILHPDLRQVSRRTYSLLDWCGDWGGLLDALFLIAELLVYPVSVHELYSRVTTLVVRKKPQYDKEPQTTGSRSDTKGKRCCQKSKFCMAIKRNRKDVIL